LIYPAESCIDIFAGWLNRAPRALAQANGEGANHLTCLDLDLKSKGKIFLASNLFWRGVTVGIVPGLEILTGKCGAVISAVHIELRLKFACQQENF
jgi:hypothetical protein